MDSPPHFMRVPGQPCVCMIRLYRGASRIPPLTCSTSPGMCILFHHSVYSFLLCICVYVHTYISPFYQCREDCSSRIASEEVCHSTTFSVPEMQSCVEQKQPTSPALPSKPVDRPSMGTKAPHTKRTSLGIGVPKKTQAPLVSRNPAPPKQTTTVSLCVLCW